MHWYVTYTYCSEDFRSRRKIFPMSCTPEHATPAPAFPEPAELASALRERLPEFGRVGWEQTTGSTNADLMRQARASGAGGPTPWLLGAHLQTAGRGRVGRVWENQVGDALMFSCAFTAKIPLPTLPGLSPALGVAACEALRGLLQGEARADAQRLVLKWPNDIQFNDAKLAGILVETAFQSGQQGVTVVAGIGLNLRGGQRLALSLGRAVADWESVPKPGSANPAAADVVAAIARAWVGAVGDYARAGYAVFQPRFDRLDALAGTRVEVIDQGRTVQGGIACGTDPEGRLLLSTPQGRFPVLVGDVSVRPQSGVGKGNHDHSA